MSMPKEIEDKAAAIRGYLTENIWVILSAFVVSLVTIIALVFSQGSQHMFPTNFIVLAVFTLAEAVFIWYSGEKYRSKMAITAMDLTALIATGLGLFAIQTKWDFTPYGILLFIALLTLTVTGFINFVVEIVAELALFCCGVVLFSLFLIYHTQLIVHGDHKHQISLEEYIVGALLLCLDIVCVFMYLLRIIAAVSTDQGIDFVALFT